MALASAALACAMDRSEASSLAANLHASRAQGLHNTGSGSVVTPQQATHAPSPCWPQISRGGVTRLCISPLASVTKISRVFRTRAIA
eukprot:6174420-Pleurochrysis_carterae.AAC.3